ncbi:hypothetical protein PMAYCL1PPCAC_20272 [Pristionchus mayeri]|uniref:AMP-binding enzyme C-terminal domain-containing protein n=1 Tax=Pristionchus mayeri TaxID=1317129 RepID=A0AAN5CU27_9BILA|nr:hypothetical protein PMAYCL1PPCAC_20272 [Pristionchus mayeri]
MSETGMSHVPLLLQEGVNAAAGVPASFYEQKIVEPTTHTVCKQWGELWIRGAPQTAGYLNNPEPTKELIDDQGWIHTGDIGYVDERGFLYIVDRMKDMIKVSYKTQANQVAPAQIEGILLTHLKIRDAAVVGITVDQKVGELIRAFVVRADDTLECEEVEALVAGKLAEYITGGVFFMEAIPRAPTGKIIRRALKELTTA